MTLAVVTLHIKNANQCHFETTDKLQQKHFGMDTECVSVYKCDSRQGVLNVGYTVGMRLMLHQNMVDVKMCYCCSFEAV